MPSMPPSLKALVSSRPGPVSAPPGIRRLYEHLAEESVRRRLGTRPWLVFSTAATLTLNSPDSLPVLHSVASARSDATRAAQLMREVGLKCISFNGIPRTINGLVALRRSLPPAVVDNLPTQARRRLDPQNIQSVGARGNHLFSAVYRSLTRPLVDKLSDAHPDLPIYIVGSHYGALLADPPGDVTVATVGHLLTSIVAVACLRAQTGVEPQLLSHVYGLRKCCEKEAWKTDWVAETGQDETAIPWLMGDDGCEWLLKSVDAIAEALGSSSEPQ